MPQTIFVQMDVQVITWLQNEATTLFADRKSAEKVKIPSTAAWKSLPKWRKISERGREVKYRSSGNLYPNAGKSVKRVEIPTSSGCVSLPK